VEEARVLPEETGLELRSPGTSKQPEGNSMAGKGHSRSQAESTCCKGPERRKEGLYGCSSEMWGKGRSWALGVGRSKYPEDHTKRVCSSWQAIGSHGRCVSRKVPGNLLGLGQGLRGRA
jgi:hypothetical protein